MSSSLVITTELNSNNLWEVSAEILAGGDLPREIFVYENLGTTDLGDYIGVAAVEELQRFQIFSGTAIAKFGNRFVRYVKAHIILTDYSERTSVIENLTENVKILSNNIKAASTVTQTVIIP